jgi:hypothetical protein
MVETGAQVTLRVKQVRPVVMAECSGMVVVVATVAQARSAVVGVTAGFSAMVARAAMGVMG